MRTTKASKLRQYGTVLVRAAVTVVLVAALTSAIVAAGFDFFPR
jgi:hypothetical protein